MKNICKRVLAGVVSMPLWLPVAIVIIPIAAIVILLVVLYNLYLYALTGE